mgnify:CR=1 FL=1
MIESEWSLLLLLQVVYKLHRIIFFCFLLFRTLQDSIDNQAISVMLPGVICSTYLERLREYGFDPLHRDLLVPPHSATAKIQLNMLKSLWTKTI